MRVALAAAMAWGISSSALGDHPSARNPATGSWLICIGNGACSQITDERCGVALGDNVQFPPHSGHVLVTRDGVVFLGYLDRRVVAMIDAEAARYGSLQMPPDYVAKWNASCTVLDGNTGV